MTRARRGRGEGTVFRRGDGLWVGGLTVSTGPTGRRVRRVVYGRNKAQALERLERLRQHVLQGDVGNPERLTVGAYLERWLADSARPAVRPTTYRLYSDLVRLHVVPHLGGVRLGRLGPAHVQHLLSVLEQAGASLRTRQKVYRLLHRALKVAVQWGLASRNACQAVACPRGPRPAVQAFTPEEVGRLLAAARGERLEALIVLAVATGLRQGELFGLRWQDVHLAEGTLSVHHQLSELAGRLWLSEPKTAASRRQVVLPQAAVRALQEHRRRMLAEGRVRPEGFVFCDTDGGPLRKSNFLRRVWYPLLERAGLPRGPFHRARHTTASLLLARGVHPKLVQALLGHSRVSTTLDTYSHLVPALGRETAAAMDAAMAAL